MTTNGCTFPIGAIVKKNTASKIKNGVIALAKPSVLNMIQSETAKAQSVSCKSTACSWTGYTICDLPSENQPSSHL